MKSFIKKNELTYTKEFDKYLKKIIYNVIFVAIV